MSDSHITTEPERRHTMSNTDPEKKVGWRDDPVSRVFAILGLLALLFFMLAIV